MRADLTFRANPRLCPRTQMNDQNVFVDMHVLNGKPLIRVPGLNT
ncbi:hypothetical protein C8J41_10314 [Sphingomonas sp. PP-CC-3G-468]|nr:hypothetical protein C8J39_2757 [Sphingomonas sp. PP-CC-1A-547]TCM07114.1 hypothetical protein C8J41_10314 [Sphingomonas sp. PP-CC-3G-468]